MKQLFLTLALIVVCFNMAEANNYYVDPRNGSNNNGDGSQSNPWRTISIALDETGIRPGPVLQDGDVLYVLPGTLNTVPDSEGWPEVFPIRLRNGISLISVEGVESTIIDADSSARIFHCETIDDTTTTIKGFTITESNNDGIYCKNASIKILNNKITKNIGSGIYCDHSSPKIANNIIENNNYTVSGSKQAGGIYIISGNPVISNNTISHNTISRTSTGSPKTGGIGCASGSPIIINNEISHNKINGWDAMGGGIYCNNGNPVIKNNRIMYNE